MTGVKTEDKLSGGGGGTGRRLTVLSVPFARERLGPCLSSGSRNRYRDKISGTGGYLGVEPRRRPYGVGEGGAGQGVMSSQLSLWAAEGSSVLLGGSGRRCRT